MRCKLRLTAKRLRKLLHYNPRTGQFLWLIDRPPIKKGRQAGTITFDGYRQIVIDDVCHRASRLAFLYMTGQWPKNMVDHRNTVRDDDRWRNLREATRAQNGANMRDRLSKVSLKGVSKHTKDGKFQAFIGVNCRRIYLGRFDRAEDAHAAYIVAAKRHFGNFARAS